MVRRYHDRRSWAKIICSSSSSTLYQLKHATLNFATTSRALCEFPGCFRRPAPAIPGELYPRYCSCHKSSLAAPVPLPANVLSGVTTFLQRQGPNDCMVTSSDGWLGSKMATFHLAYPEAGMVDMNQYDPSSTPRFHPKYSNASSGASTAPGEDPVQIGKNISHELQEGTARDVIFSSSRLPRAAAGSGDPATSDADGTHHDLVG